MEFPSLLRPAVARLSGILRLRGPLADDPAARTLHALLLSILAWDGAYMAFWFPVNVIKKSGTVGITLTIALTAVIALSVLRRGSLRESATIYVGGMWLAFSVWIFLSGGIQSSALILYMALPISAAWLLGYRGTLWTAAGCLASALLLEVLAKEGVGQYTYFGNGRFGFGMIPNLILAILMVVVPIARVMKTLKDALAQRKRVEEELLRHQEHLQVLVDQRTAELVSALDRAEAANRAKTLFLANMSHELRTPLNAILGFSDLIRRDEGVSPKQGEALGIINRSGTHLLALIDDILDMARIESGERVLEISSVDLIELVRESMIMMRGPAEQKNLALLIEWSEAPIRMVRADGPKLRQILVNLVGNAIKYTDAGSITLRLDSALEDDTGKVRLRIEVQDTGIGIAPEAQASIFDPFVQLNHPNARKGSGLGLAICRQFAQMMEGDVQVQSEPGRGATFRVELLAQAAEEFHTRSPAEAIEESFKLQPDQPQHRILVIEDDQANSLLLKRLLDGAGFQVRTAESGEAGIAAFLVWDPHFIWLDIQLPGINGREVAAQIRKMAGGRDVKIVALTASVFAEERDAVLSAGIDDFVRKPYRAKAIFECMERLLGVRYACSTPWTKSVSDPSPRLLSQVVSLPDDLKSQLLKAVLLLEIERITEVIELVSAVNPALGTELSRRADAFEFTAIMRAIQSEEAAWARAYPCSDL